MQRRQLFRLLLGAGALAVPCHGQEEYEHAGGKSSSRIPETERVDINRATVEELLKVPGMSRTWAQRIVRFRPYHAKNDLLEQGIVPGDVYKRIRDYLIAHRVPTK